MQKRVEFESPHFPGEFQFGLVFVLGRKRAENHLNLVDISDSNLMQDLQLQTVPEDEIKHIKAKLEAKYLGKLSRTTVTLQPYGHSLIKLICKNNLENKEKCPFQVQFYPYGDKYLMKIKNTEHLPECRLDVSQAAFANNKLILDSYREELVKILKTNPLLKPKEILDILVEKLKLDPNFLFFGLEGDRNFERRMKKKFDNTILELRNFLSIDIVPKKTKQETNSKGSKSKVKIPRRRSSKKARVPKSFKEYQSSEERSLFSLSSTGSHIVNNLHMFLSIPAIELIHDQDPTAMRIHLVNRSKEKEEPKATRPAPANSRTLRFQLRQITESEEGHD